MAGDGASYLRQLREAGAPIPPDAIEPPPSFDRAVDRWILCAFHDLSTCRAVGMTIGPIPWTAIVAYADRAGFTGSTATAFVEVIRTMDLGYLEDERARLAAAAKG